MRLGNVRATPFAALAAALLAGAVIAAPSSATAEIHWHEVSSIGKTKVMTYDVTGLEISKKGWSAHVALHNLTKTTVYIQPDNGLAFFTGKSESLPPVLTSGVAQYTPSFPSQLGPGKTWTGVFRSSKPLDIGKKTLYARVILGLFAVKLPGHSTQTYHWETDHFLIVGGAGTGPVI
jgi:hypothetical protein